MKMRISARLFAGLLLGLSACCQAVFADWISGRVVGVHDGDTVTLLQAGNRQTKIRLDQIDAPELSQAFGQSSKQSLSELAFGKEVRVEVVDTDKYGRTVGTVWVGRMDANLEQINRGQAWAYRKYLKDSAYLDAEETAKRARRGIWSQPDAIPPWEFRHGRKAALTPVPGFTESKPTHPGTASGQVGFTATR